MYYKVKIPIVVSSLLSIFVQERFPLKYSLYKPNAIFTTIIFLFIVSLLFKFTFEVGFEFVCFKLANLYISTS